MPGACSPAGAMRPPCASLPGALHPHLVLCTLPGAFLPVVSAMGPALGGRQRTGFQLESTLHLHISHRVPTPKASERTPQGLRAGR